tara:strand:+ start:1183 stop:1302 length:120 start_codon:yes stop_codon:yes gene_type:complete
MKKLPINVSFVYNAEFRQGDPPNDPPPPPPEDPKPGQEK